MHTRVINAHTLEPSTGERQKNAWIDIADGRIVDSGAGRPPLRPVTFESSMQVGVPSCPAWSTPTSISW